MGKNFEYDVYIAGHIDLQDRVSTKNRFGSVEAILTERGLKVYNPARKELGEYSRHQLGAEDFNALDRTRSLLVVTDRLSFGTLIEAGYFTALKRRDPSRLLVFCYLGKDSYKFTTTYDFIKNHSPMSIYFDLVTNSVEEAINYILDRFRREEG